MNVSVQLGIRRWVKIKRRVLRKVKWGDDIDASGILYRNW